MPQKEKYLRSASEGFGDLIRKLLIGGSVEAKKNREEIFYVLLLDGFCIDKIYRSVYE